MPIPQLPSEISPDGREVWDWAANLSDRVALVARHKEIRAAILDAESTCGSCSLWMTSACPREVHDNRKGHKVGPSCKSPKCAGHVMQSWDVQRIEGLKTELSQIETKLQASNLCREAT
jgi:hypothetical protein